VPESDAENVAGLSVGEYLRSIRESRGVTLDEASRVTRIGKNYLVAIEQGNFEKLPNPAYIKGFIRLYAGFLGLSGDDLVLRYEQGLPPPLRPQVEPQAKAQRPGFEIMERTKLGGHSRWVVPLVLLVLVGAASMLWNDREEKPARPIAAQPAAQQPAKAAVLPPRSSAQTAASPAQVPGQAPAAVQPPVAPPAQAPAQGSPGAPAVKVEPLPPVVAPGEKQSGIILRLRFTKDSWLSITIDENIWQRYDLKAGDVIEWKGSRVFVVDVGDGGAVEAEFNGRPLKALGEPGKPAHAVLKAQ
jgi:cytoskeleton protein RodZ